MRSKCADKKNTAERQYSFELTGGEGGIRTPEALIQTCTLSRGVHSTTLPPLRRSVISQKLMRTKE